MYLPKHFQQNDTKVLFDLIEHFPLGTLVTTSPTGLEANHLPFELVRQEDGRNCLFCHVARSNTVWQYASESDCLVIFQGPSAYISPSLYVSKKETHMVVPTYNYVAVHVSGKVIVHDDIRTVRGAVSRLTQRFEKHRKEPWKMGDAPSTFIDERLTHIVALEIQIRQLEGKWKMSQNRSQGDQQSVMAGLETGNENEKAVAEIMHLSQRKP